VQGFPQRLAQSLGRSRRPGEALGGTWAQVLVHGMIHGRCISADEDGRERRDLANCGRARSARGTDSLRVVHLATISNLKDSTSEDPDTGAVRSVQTADLSLPERVLRELWLPVNLERLARTYWRFLQRVTLGLVRVRYTPTGRALVLITPAIKLICFAAPEYELKPGHGIVRWRITRGLLVAKRGRDGHGYLQIEVRRARSGEEESLSSTPALLQVQVSDADVSDADAPVLDAPALLHVEVEVAGFYPSIASGLGRRVYGITQSRIHVLITHAFLRSLARLDLAESRVGRFAQP
jgi:hypothetical protein